MNLGPKNVGKLCQPPFYRKKIAGVNSLIATKVMSNYFVHEGTPAP